MKLLLVRHGETTWNLEGRYQGRQEAPLSKRGIQQARALAQRLRSEGIDAIISSPLLRAADTARICADCLGLDVAFDERLLEISHGTWEGKLREEVAQGYPALLELWSEQPAAVTFPQGESLADVQRRLDLFLSESRPSATLLALTHDVVVRLAVLTAQGRTLEHFNDVQIDNAAISEFELSAGLLTLRRLNEASYLGPLRSPLASQAR